MGQGDQKPKYSPAHKPIYDNVLGLSFAECVMRHCPHPEVQKKYGVGGECNVSVYVCQKCQFGVKHKLFAGWGCNYGKNGE